MKHLIPTFELCKALQKKFPEQKASFNWYAHSGCSVSDREVSVGKAVNYTVGHKKMWDIGFNIGALCFVKEIIPAYTLQDIIELYDGSEKIKTVQQLAEILTAK